ncbi:MAG: hypothetical protein ACW98J_08575, partial [Candidatus Thorarchaeota archaeon]
MDPEIVRTAPDNVSIEPLLANESRGEIEIYSNSDMTLQADEEGWPGDGTSGSPYLIEGYFVSGLYRAVRIENVDAYFIIRNCILEVTEEWATVVNFFSVSNGRIESCNIIGGTGVGLFDCIDCALVNNTFTVAHEDLYLIDCRLCDFEENKFSGRGLQM